MFLMCCGGTDLVFDFKPIRITNKIKMESICFDLQKCKEHVATITFNTVNFNITVQWFRVRKHHNFLNCIQFLSPKCK